MSMPATAPPPQDAALERSAVPDVVARRGLDEAQWRTLMGSLFPGARPESVLMVVDYCRARKLDPLKKPCHLVPMRVKDAKTGEWGWRDVVMPGIYEYRTTAMRTGQYAGHSQPEYGPMTEVAGVTAPEWCAMTIYRRMGHERIEFPVRVYFREAVALKDGKANDRWSKAPIQMLTKCTEAAGLREAFPDEFGGEATAEEMEGQVFVDEPKAPAIQQPQRKVEAPPPTVVDVALTPKPAAAPDVPGVTVALERRQPASGGPAFWIVRTSDQRIFLRPEDGDGWSEIVQALQRAQSEQRAVVLTLAAVEGQKYPNVVEVAYSTEAAS